MPKPMSHKFIVALLNRGETFVKYTGKYRVYTCSKAKGKDGRPAFYYIGRSGAIRAGVTSANSKPLTGEAKQRLIDEYETLKEQGELDRNGNLKT